MYCITQMIFFNVVLVFRNNAVADVFLKKIFKTGLFVCYFFIQLYMTEFAMCQLNFVKIQPFYLSKIWN